MAPFFDSQCTLKCFKNGDGMTKNVENGVGVGGIIYSVIVWYLHVYWYAQPQCCLLIFTLKVPEQLQWRPH